jgi:hypothetical protein
MVHSFVSCSILLPMVGADALVHKESIEGLKLRKPITTWELWDGQRDLQVPIYRVPWIEIGGLRIEPATIAVHPTPIPPPIHDVSIEGLIGLQVLEKFIVEINHQDQRVRLLTTRLHTQKEITTTAASHDTMTSTEMKKSVIGC